MVTSRFRTGLLLASTALATVACSAGTPPTSLPGESGPPSSGSVSRPAGDQAATTRGATATSPAKAALARMTLRQRVGQLIMVGGPATGVHRATRQAITDYHVGNVMLTGRSARGVSATAAVTAGLQGRVTSSATAGVPLFVATDQEGGYVQVLSGPGFSTIPTALAQGTWLASTLRTRATSWGRQLHSAGVNVNLAPVADTVPRDLAYANKPIGYYHREFGYRSKRVTGHAIAFARGMRDAGVAATSKHFPGLGRVTANTDTTAGVSDDITTRTSRYLDPFAKAVADGAPLVMISSAYYSRIDPAYPAVFSRTIVTDLLRDQLGFHGVAISDDLGNARQVASWSPGSRARRFVSAGGDMVLTVDPTLAAQMSDRLVARATEQPGFRLKVDAAALRVLRAKEAAGLLR